MLVKVMSSPETAAVLRQALGPIRAWRDCLADMRRYRTSVDGCTLMPFCKVHDGKGHRPYYRTSDVVEFIKDVIAANSGMRPGFSPRVDVVEHDPLDVRSWKAREYKLKSA